MKTQNIDHLVDEMVEKAVENISSPQVVVEIFEEPIPEQEPVVEPKDTFFIKQLDEERNIESQEVNICEEGCGNEENEFIEVQNEESEEEFEEEPVEKSQMDNLSESIILMKEQLNKM